MMSRRGASIAVSTAFNAAQVLLLQVLALVSLGPSDFGLFSLQYLGFALASSLCLSLVSETWMRLRTGNLATPTWRDFSTMLVYLSGLSGLAVLLMSLVVADLRPVALAGAVAVAANAYRSGARYHEMTEGHVHRVLVSDASGFLTTGIVWVLLTLLTHYPALNIVTIAWATGSVLSAAIARLPRPAGPKVAAQWITAHRSTIKPLLRDSLLMDLGAIGTPYIVAPVLGITSFGIYRAVSNVAAPVRLVLNPIRPLVGSRPLSALRAKRAALVAIAISIGFGTAAFGCLFAIDRLSLELGALSAVSAFALPTALFVSASFLGHFFYIVARSHLGGGRLLIGRIAQTALAVVVPIVGALVGGLDLAVWGYATATVASSLCWTYLVVRAPDE